MIKKCHFESIKLVGVRSGGENHGVREAAKKTVLLLLLKNYEIFHHFLLWYQQSRTKISEICLKLISEIFPWLTCVVTQIQPWRKKARWACGYITWRRRLQEFKNTFGGTVWWVCKIYLFAKISPGAQPNWIGIQVIQNWSRPACSS